MPNCNAASSCCRSSESATGEVRLCVTTYLSRLFCTKKLQLAILEVDYSDLIFKTIYINAST